MRCIVDSARLKVVIAVPDHIRDAVKAENAEAQEALSRFPRHAATLIRVQDSDAYCDFLESLDFAAIRDEIRRKAKKLDLSPPSGDFPVSIDCEPERIVLHVTVK